MFTVISQYDLNVIPHLAEPVYIEDEKTVCCLCCAEGPITARVSLAKQGFVPGERIPVTVDIQNKSSININRIYAALVQHIAFYAEGSSKRSTRMLSDKIHMGEVGGNTDVRLPECSVLVPACVASELRFCNNIKIDYYLTVNVNPDRACSFSMDAKVPIVIGTIPLWSMTQYGVGFAAQGPPGGFAQGPPGGFAQGQPGGFAQGPPAGFAQGTPGGFAQGPPAGFAQGPPAGFAQGPPAGFAQGPSGGFDAGAAAAAAAPPIIPTAPPDAPPPSYESCVFGTVNADDNDDDGTAGQYAPQYPYFTGLQQPTAPPPPIQK